MYPVFCPVGFLNHKLQNMFYSWKEEQRENFLDLCTGVKGVKMMYDFMGKEIFNDR